MNWKTRIASINDLEAIYKIEQLCFDDIDVFEKDIFKFFLYKRGAIFLLAYLPKEKKKETIVGFIIVHQKAFATYEIVTIDVHPSWQSKGIGTQFLQEIEDIITSKIKDENQSTLSFAIELVVYEKNTKAKTLYEKCGYYYVETLKNYYSRGRNGLKMVKTIEILET